MRLYQGDMEQATVYNADPASQAQAFAKEGFSWLHIVDLNGAFDGAPVNAEAVRAIIGATDLPVQLGGGIRTLRQIEAWLAEGVSRVILGTVAVRDPELVRQACALFPGQVVLGIDARGDYVAVEGWAETSEMSVIELAQSFDDAGAAAIVYTDIDRDGTGHGINAERTRKLAESVLIPVIASGGVGSLEDLEKVRDIERYGVEGVIIGRAFYDRKIEPKAALEIASGIHA